LERDFEIYAYEENELASQRKKMRGLQSKPNCKTKKEACATRRGQKERMENQNPTKNKSIIQDVGNQKVT